MAVAYWLNIYYLMPHRDRDTEQNRKDENHTLQIIPLTYWHSQFVDSI